MITGIRTMVSCHWCARRLQRYLDMDPSVPLTPADNRKLSEHLNACARCATAADEYRGLRRSLLRWSQHRPTDPAAVSRLRRESDRLVKEELP